MNSSTFILGFILTIIYLTIYLVLSYFKITLYGDFQQMSLSIVCGFIAAILSKDDGKQRLKNSIVSIIICVASLIILLWIIPQADFDIYGGWIGFVYLFLLLFCPNFACMLICSMIYIFVIVPFFQGIKNKS